MNEQQIRALVAVSEDKNVFISGQAGTGKSFTLKHIIKYLKQNNKKFAITASTGCAAVLINGQTIHSYLGIGINNTNLDKIYKEIKIKKMKYNKLFELQVIIIDEISMIDDTTFDFINELLCLIKGDKRPFGGIQMILVGDFCQLPPVKGNYCFNSKIWKSMSLETIHLTELMRQKDDIEFQEILQEIRFGKCSKKTFNRLLQLENTTFDNIRPTKLYSLNTDVKKINDYEFNKLCKKNTGKNIKEATVIQCFPDTNDIMMCNESFDDNECIIRYNALSNDKYTKLDDYTIDLIKGLQVMITRNINFDTGLVNGTLGTIIGLNRNTVSIIDMHKKTHTISYHTDTNNNNKTHVNFMPIKLAYALSIHKSQGTTLEAIEVDGSTYIFASGQLYTALSRAKNLSSIRLLNLDKDSFMCNKEVKNLYSNIE